MMRRTLQSQRRARLLALSVLALLALFARPTTTAAHPLGNFTINVYSRLDIGTTTINVTYIIDQAEVPTFQQFGGKLLAPEAYGEQLINLATAARDNLRLRVDGRAYPLALTEQRLSFLPGQAGLATSRIELQLVADVPALSSAQRTITYEDGNYPDRIGWHEIVARPAAGVKFVNADVPSNSVSNELRTYPQDMLSSPLNARAAQITVTPGAAANIGGSVPTVVGTRVNDRFAALIATEQIGPLVIALALLAAMGLGAAHALTPGHGKTVVAAYLIGTRGTARHALFLGLTVTITHTLGVFIVGLVTLYASQYILPEQLYPWISALSGGLVVVMGIVLLRQRIRTIIARQHHDHAHDHHHDHTHDHHHDHEHVHAHGGHVHSHLPPGADGTPLTWRSLLALGISGGLLPCPSGLIVMLSAIALGRVGFGLLLIIAFSLGLAVVISGIGLLFVYGGRWLNNVGADSRWRRYPLLGQGMRLVPIASALFVTTAGMFLTMQALAQAGVLR